MYGLYLFVKKYDKDGVYVKYYFFVLKNMFVKYVYEFWFVFFDV